MPANQITISTQNRGLLFGDAIFDTIRVVSAKVFFLEDHYFRLTKSMRIMRMEIPMDFTLEYFENNILEAVEAVGLSKLPARVRYTIYREGEGYYKPISSQIGYFIRATPLSSAEYEQQNTFYGIDFYKDHRIASELLSTIKTNNKAINVLAGIFASDHQLDNCLIMNTHKNIAEAINGNVFIINGKHIITPPLSEGCIDGIIRKQIINRLPLESSYIVEERALSPFELQAADEVFLTNTISGIITVTQFRKKIFNTTLAESLIPRLNQWAMEPISALI